MARPSGRIIRGLFRLHFNQIPSNPTPQNGVFSSANSSSGLSSLRNVILEPHSNLCIHQPTFVNRGFSQISSKHNCPTPSVEYVIRNYSSGVLSSGLSKSSCLNPEINLKLQTFSNFSSRSLGLHKHPGNLSGCRYFSFRSSDFGKLNGIFTKTVVDKPLSVVRSAFTRYREAVGLQVEAFFKRNYLVLVGATGVALCILLWRVMFGIANTFVGLSEGMAKYGFLALSTAIVAFTGLYVRSRFTVNPDKVYRMAMRKLNTSVGILEVMGAPLSGTDLRAYVMSGGGLRLKNFKPRLASKRCFLIFPIHGSERKGLVSVEVKRKKGQYDMKLLAVDIPMTKGPDQRLFLVGDEEEYKIGGGLISELRDPIVKAMAAEKEFEALDQKEEEDDAKKEIQEEERRNREEVEKLEKGSL